MMTRFQKIILTVLMLAVMAVCSGLTYFVGWDLLTNQFVSLASDTETATTVSVQPTVILVWPTATPTPAIATSTGEQAILFAQNFKYDPAQGKNIVDLVNTLQAASQKLGNDVLSKGWQAQDQTTDRWVVTYSYQENTDLKSYEFLVDLNTGYIKAHNEGGDTILNFLLQDSQVTDVKPTATPVTIYIGWATRDYFTNWEYHVPDEAQSLKSIQHSGQELNAEDGHLVVPIVLHNLSQTTKTLRSDYYHRFQLRDSSGQLASLAGIEHFKIPTRLFCRSQNLPEWTEKNIDIPGDQTIATALAFQLRPNTQPPYTLEITVYEFDVPHRYNIRLTEK